MREETQLSKEEMNHESVYHQESTIVVAERAFVAQRLGRVNAAFDDEVGLPCRSLVRRLALGKTVFNSGKMFSRLAQPAHARTLCESSSRVAQFFDEHGKRLFSGAARSMADGDTQGLRRGGQCFQADVLRDES